MKKFSIKANLLDVVARRIYPAELDIENGRIQRIKELRKEQGKYILPGFVDAHVHIESSMLTPLKFSRAAISHGSLASVSDPHEIANVLGIPGLEYMIKSAGKTPFKILFGPEDQSGPGPNGLKQVIHILAKGSVVHGVLLEGNRRNASPDCDIRNFITDLIQPAFGHREWAHGFSDIEAAGWIEVQ